MQAGWSGAISAEVLAAFRQRLDTLEHLAQEALGWTTGWRYEGQPEAWVAHWRAWPPESAVLLVFTVREFLRAYELVCQTPPSLSSYIRGQDHGYREAYEDVLRGLGSWLGIEVEKGDGTPDPMLTATTADADPGCQQQRAP